MQDTSGKGSSSPMPAASDSKLTVGRKFSQQLEGLIVNLNSTQPRYIRCIKPNQLKKPDTIAAKLVDEQLTYSGVFEAVLIMQNGYPFRLSHLEFRERFHMLITNKVDKNILFDSDSFDIYLQYPETYTIPSNRPARFPSEVASKFHF